ncbi:TetR/AcrR family transcriptional regulator [Pseudolysinimonas kribbensis]|uniref:Transcriptional regulator n=1 Tax=Pseudolysinimonas kribbensis TaxID=433641 RepID=A0ABQ6K916_9MICO|nr:TetR/AcrR family transcriptional regulator [Pseudolysinimonas kribbensis]GMA95874.1 transcriptional regulator [Pseudolysinimonas kribbensis]
MPKRVDHEQRRREIIEAAWRLVARGGFAAATMREIAAEAGFANGGLKYYFDSKDDLLIAAFQHTFYRVNERAALSIGDRTGLEAIRLLCLEMLPLDDERSVEARVAVAFWDRAASSKAMRKIHADSFAIWRTWMENELQTARRNGRLNTAVSDRQIVDEFLAVTAGLRIMPILEAGAAEPLDQVELIDALVARLEAGDPAHVQPRTAAATPTA